MEKITYLLMHHMPDPAELSNSTTFRACKFVGETHPLVLADAVYASIKPSYVSRSPPRHSPASNDSSCKPHPIPHHSTQGMCFMLGTTPLKFIALMNARVAAAMMREAITTLGAGRARIVTTRTLLNVEGVAKVLRAANCTIVAEKHIVCGPRKFFARVFGGDEEWQPLEPLGKPAKRVMGFLQGPLRAAVRNARRGDPTAVLVAEDFADLDWPGGVDKAAMLESAGNDLRHMRMGDKRRTAATRLASLGLPASAASALLALQCLAAAPGGGPGMQPSRAAMLARTAQRAAVGAGHARRVAALRLAPLGLPASAASALLALQCLAAAPGGGPGMQPPRAAALARTAQRKAENPDNARCVAALRLAPLGLPASAASALLALQCLAAAPGGGPGMQPLRAAALARTAQRKAAGAEHARRDAALRIAPLGLPASAASALLALQCLPTAPGGGPGMQPARAAALARTAQRAAENPDNARRDAALRLAPLGLPASAASALLALQCLAAAPGGGPGMQPLRAAALARTAQRKAANPANERRDAALRLAPLGLPASAASALLAVQCLAAAPGGGPGMQPTRAAALARTALRKVAGAERARPAAALRLAPLGLPASAASALLAIQCLAAAPGGGPGMQPARAAALARTAQRNAPDAGNARRKAATRLKSLGLPTSAASALLAQQFIAAAPGGGQGMEPASAAAKARNAVKKALGKDFVGTI